MSEGIKAVLQRNMSSALNRGDMTQAAQLLECLREEDPLSVETRGMELEYLMRNSRLPEAQTLANQLVESFPRSPRIHYLAGQVAYRLKDYKTAVERFRESHRVNPQWRSALFLAKSATQRGELDAAASIFESLLPEHTECYRDLAWLYERREDLGRALTAIETYLLDHPEDEWAKSQRMRLRARVMDPEELISDTHKLLEFGEELPESVLTQYVEALFRTGKAAEVRQFVAERRPNLSPQAATGAGWICYRYQAYDLAMELFSATLRINHRNVKFLSAIEFAANRSGKLADLIQLYESFALEHRHLFGRFQNPKRRTTASNSNRKA